MKQAAGLDGHVGPLLPRPRRLRRADPALDPLRQLEQRRSTANQAGNWARYWRQEVQWYIHAYHTVTGVDLSADMHDVRQAELRPDRYMQPAFHLQRRLVQQRRRLLAQRSEDGHGRRRVRRIELEQGEASELPGEQHARRQLSE